MITSLRNDKVRLVQALQNRRRNREQARRFVIEGYRLGQEALRSGIPPHFVLYTASAREDERGDALLETWRQQGVICLEVSPEVMEACSDTETPQGLLAVVPFPDLPRPTHPTLTLILDQLRDPGNMGTILRTGLAAGVDQVLLLPGTVDPTNPKVVRSGMGAHFRLPLAAMGWEEVRRATASSHVYVATPHRGIPYTEADWTEPVALIVGGETTGVSPQARALTDVPITIPMEGDTESLNAAIAAAVILFEAVRQRRVGQQPAPERNL